MNVDNLYIANKAVQLVSLPPKKTKTNITMHQHNLGTWCASWH